MKHLTITEQRLKIVDDYMKSGEPWPATARQIATWAIREKRWAPQRDAVLQECAEELARAMREEVIVDAQGRTVRTKHAARLEEHGEQLTYWDDIRWAEPKHMEVAFAQRRRSIVSDCRQLKSDVDSYNENTNKSIPIQMVWDFTADLIELEALDAMEPRRATAIREASISPMRSASASGRSAGETSQLQPPSRYPGRL